VILVIPRIAGAKLKQPGPDFDVYHFSKKNDLRASPILVCYIGNFPTFPGELPEGVTVEDLNIGGLRARAFEWRDSKARFYRSALVKLPENFRFPQYVKFDYRKLDQDEKALADAIIDSVKPGPEHQ
jgi:hypothetical protein